MLRALWGLQIFLTLFYFITIQCLPYPQPLNQSDYRSLAIKKAIAKSKSVIPKGATVHNYDWNITSEIKNIEGNNRQVFLINGKSPGPTIEGDQGDWVVTKVNNHLDVPITIHWHGIHQRDTPFSDGSPGITQWPIKSGDSFSYKYRLDQYGFYWYHAHYSGYANDGINGPIYIRPNSTVPRPYSDISNNREYLELFEKLEKSPQQLIMTDWFKDDFGTVASKLFNYGMDPTCVRSLLINGKGRHVCMDTTTKTVEAQSKTKVLKKALGTDSVSIDAYGCLDLGKLNGFSDKDYNKSKLEFPGYNTDCQNATTDREIIYTNDQSYIMLNILNAGGEFSKMVSIDDHNITIIAVDGEFVKPKTGQQVYLTIGQRVTVLVKTNKADHKNTSKPFAIRTACNDMPQIIEGLAYLVYGSESNSNIESIQKILDPNNGKRYQNHGAELCSQYGDLQSIDPRKSSPYNTKLKPPTGAADVTLYLNLTKPSMSEFAIVDNTPMNMSMELGYPLLYNLSASTNDRDGKGSKNYTEIMGATVLDQGIKYGDVVDVIFQNTALADHPMHLHGHSFWNIAINDNTATFLYSTVEEALQDGKLKLFNFENPAYIDNVGVTLGGYAIVRFVADNPGVWMIHCHIQTHMSAGMAAVFIEAELDIPKYHPEHV